MTIKKFNRLEDKGYYKISENVIALDEIIFLMHVSKGTHEERLKILLEVEIEQAFSK